MVTFDGVSVNDIARISSSFSIYLIGHHVNVQGVIPSSEFHHVDLIGNSKRSF